MEQLFQLSGEGFDIEELARLFARGSVTVKKIEDNYYLQLPGWFTKPPDAPSICIGMETPVFLS
jgi:hypothetical protein